MLGAKQRSAKTRFGREKARFGRQKAPSPSMNSWLFCRNFEKRSRTEIPVLGYEKTVLVEKAEILLSSEGPGRVWGFRGFGLGVREWGSGSLYDSPLRSFIVVPKTHSSTSY